MNDDFIYLDVIAKLHKNVVKIVDGVAYDKNGNKVELDTDAIELELAKVKKIKMLRKDKEIALNKPIMINNKNFISSLEAYNKYKVAYDAGVDAGITKGEVICLVDSKPTWIEVTKEELEEYFKRFRARGYVVERHLGKLIELVNNATTKEEVEAIKWESVND